MNFTDKINRTQIRQAMNNKRPYAEMIVALISKIAVITISIFYFGVVPPIEVICASFGCFTTAYGLYSRKHSWLFYDMCGAVCVVVYAPSRAIAFATKLLEEVPMQYDLSATQYSIISIVVDLCGVIYVAFSGYIVLRLAVIMLRDDVPVKLSPRLYPKLPTATGEVKFSHSNVFQDDQNDSKFYSV